MVNNRQKIETELKAKRIEENKKKIPRYFWARFKNDRRNYIKAKNWLYKKIGDTSWKKYNGGILITAETDQSHILKNIKLGEEDPFTTIEPHRSFNTSWGCIYSKDLESYTQEELLAMCPPEVINVEKPLTKKPLIFLHLSFNSCDLD